MSMTTIDQNTTKAIRTLGIYTAGRFDIWGLAGSSRASCRAHVMADLLGLPRIAQSKAGVYALLSEFQNRCGIESTCSADWHEKFAALCRATITA